jgi:protein Tex
VGQVVKVRVLEVNEALKRINLSMRSSQSTPPRKGKGKGKKKGGKGRSPSSQQDPSPSVHQDPSPSSQQDPSPSADDLKERFNRKA